MQWFEDGDQVCVTKDDFINLQESPAVFIPSDVGRTILQDGLLGLSLRWLDELRNRLILEGFGIRPPTLLVPPWDFIVTDKEQP